MSFNGEWLAFKSLEQVRLSTEFVFRFVALTHLLCRALVVCIFVATLAAVGPRRLLWRVATRCGLAKFKNNPTVSGDAKDNYAVDDNDAIALEEAHGRGRRPTVFVANASGDFCSFIW